MIPYITESAVTTALVLGGTVYVQSNTITQYEKDAVICELTVSGYESGIGAMVDVIDEGNIEVAVFKVDTAIREKQYMVDMEKAEVIIANLTKDANLSRGNCEDVESILDNINDLTF